MRNNPEMGGQREEIGKQFGFKENIGKKFRYIIDNIYVYDHPETYKYIKGIDGNVIHVNLKKKK